MGEGRVNTHCANLGCSKTFCDGIECRQQVNPVDAMRTTELTKEDLALIDAGKQRVIAGWDKPEFIDGYTLAKARYYK